MSADKLIVLRGRRRPLFFCSVCFHMNNGKYDYNKLNAMAYGYSEFTNFSLNVYTGSCIDVQLPPLKRDYLDISAVGIYIHSLIDSNAYSSLEQSENTDPSAIVNGWIYQYDTTENDFLRIALQAIIDETAVTALLPTEGVTTVYTTLQGKQINLPAIFNLDVNRMHTSWHLHEIPWIDGPNLIGGCTVNSDWQQILSDDSHSLIFKQTVPGLIFEFDRNDRFIAIVAQPLEIEQHEIRTAYLTGLYASMSYMTDFSNFKDYVDEYTEKYVYKPCTLVYDNIVNIEQYITKVKTVTVSAGSRLPNIQTKDRLLLKYLNSPWTTFNLLTAVGELPQFFNVNQLNLQYCPRDPRYRLETVYVTSVANAFLPSLDLYKSLLDSNDKVLVVPQALFKELKDNIITMWLGANQL